MTAANVDPWKEVAGQIRAKAIVCLFPAIMFGLSLAPPIWKPHSSLNAFYPLPLVLWGLLTLLISRGAFVYLNQLSWAISGPEETATKRRKARRLKAFILCTMLISCCFAMSLMAAKLFGRLYALVAVLFGISMISMVLIAEREIKQLAVWFTRPPA
jgi:hypothetical protein